MYYIWCCQQRSQQRRQQRRRRRRWRRSRRRRRLRSSSSGYRKYKYEYKHNNKQALCRSIAASVAVAVAVGCSGSACFVIPCIERRNLSIARVTQKKENILQIRISNLSLIYYSKVRFGLSITLRPPERATPYNGCIYLLRDLHNMIHCDNCPRLGLGARRLQS